MADLDGRVAVVTGGGRGIGAGIALALAQAGADVAVNYTRNPETAEETAEAIRALGRRANTYKCDVSDLDECEALAKQAVADLGPVSILINNAGIASRGQSVADTNPAEMERVLRTHTFGAFYMSHFLVPQMRELERGDVIMITSGATHSFGANGAPYNMAKNAMEALAWTLAKEERRHNIHVNIVGPGLVDTEMGKRLVRATRGVDDIRTLDADSAFGHVCTPAEIGSVVAFLCSPGAGYVTNQRIYVDGGGF